MIDRRVVALGCLVPLAACVGVPEPVGVGTPAPDFAARTLETPAVMRRLSDYPAQAVLLNVWATWCIPCQREMPSIERLYREFGARGLRVVAVSVDDGGAERSIQEFVQEFGLTFDILHDPTGKVMQTYQLIGVPGSFLIDANGTIRKKAHETDWYADDNRALVATLLDAGG